MSKRKEQKAEKTAVVIIREDLAAGSEQLEAQMQRKVLELYCRNNHIKIDDYRLSDERYVQRADFRLMLKEVACGDYKPDYLLFTSWEIFAPLLDRFPKCLHTLQSKGIIVKSIKSQISKHSLDK